MERDTIRRGLSALCSVLLLAGLASCAAVDHHRALPSSGVVYWQQGRAMVPSDLTAQVKRIYQQLGDVAGIAVPLRIDASPAINAFASRDKSGDYGIVLNAGMVDMVGYDADQMAFVLAHELAHVALQHLSDERMEAKKREASTVELLSMLADIIVPLSGLAVSAGHAMQEAGFSREQEVDADQLGVALMVRAGFDPAGALAFQRQLLGVSDPSQLNLFSTHPPGEDRISALEAAVAGSHR